MLNPNISESNAFIRMMCGVAMTAFGIGRIARDSKCTTGRMMILAGAMKVAEGYYQYCPVTAMVKSEEMNPIAAVND
ncbi:YgaP-like transmembrane domain [Solibacillus silvestris]|uniref:YgaP-like transmembrane domain n=1 Tax=Solibacillus silvestris TaxID=76853 RepID=UPI003F7EF0F9